jgi:hypothetical protein
MGQHQPFSAADDKAWLSNLVDTFARAEQIHDEPCNAAVRAAAMARLQRPATSRRGAPFHRSAMLEPTF